MRAIRYSVLTFCRGEKITASNADHFPAASTPPVASARYRCASSSTMPASAATLTICGPADLTRSGTTAIRGSHSTVALPLGAKPVKLILHRPRALGSEHAQELQQQPPMRPQLTQKT